MPQRTYRAEPTLSPAQNATFAFDGIVGERLRASERRWLLCAPEANPAMLQMFRDRDRTPARDMVPWAGEFAGKYLISAVQALRISGSPELRRYLEEFVAELIATQAPDGYMGPWPADRRMTGEGLWDLWGQYHCMLGLYLWYRHTGERAALEAALRTADLFCRTFLEGEARVYDAGSRDKNESSAHVFALLYAETGEEKYLRMLREIERDWQKPPSGDYVRTALEGKPFHQCPKPRWESLHAVQAVAELHFLTGEEKYRRAYEQIWWSIVEGDRHNTGGFSSGEKACGNPYSPEAIETCCTIAWMALTVDMLRMTGDPRAADELELSTFNNVLGAQNPTGRWWTYNTPMDGERKASAHHIVFQARAGSPELNCCSVNAPRGLGVLSEWAVMRAPDGVVLNYYGPSRFRTATPGGGEVELRQATTYPLDGRIGLRVRCEQAEEFALRLRVPGWCRAATVSLDGDLAAEADPGTYHEIRRRWEGEHRLELLLEMGPRLWVGERECAGKVSLYHGPLLLAYDPRFDRYDPTDPPRIDPSSSPEWVEAPPLRPAPLLLLRFGTASGEGITLCDFASAGAAGNLYASWLPCPGPDPVPFGRDNPLRAQIPHRP